ncbi:hypothetical protein J437_LFUL019059 [Ladona fulva]|uniref:Uncharacterized protein n=1 Tax=Ladona fulva TaxID=123851 RepID=A0A8K0P9W5_LADFU|nr:hypothetical protein J437_LFUL019059 [Ladona fulva]
MFGIPFGGAYYATMPNPEEQKGEPYQTPAREVELEYYQTLAVRDVIEAKQESKAKERLIAVHHSPSSQRCSLPKIKIPQFSGAFTDWEAFRDLFKSIVHDREDISPTEKFSYLKTALSRGCFGSH